MFVNNLRIAFRYLVKNKIMTAINLSGLTLGFLSFILISLYLHDELTYDQFHTDADRIYRVIQHEMVTDGSTRNLAQVAAQVGESAMREFPEATDMTRMEIGGRISMGNEVEAREYQRLLFVDRNFLTLFNFKLREGDPTTALSQPFAVVISEALARRHFGNESPLGKTIWTDLEDGGKDMLVAGVLAPIPSNSHLQFDMLISAETYMTYENLRRTIPNDWTSNNYVTYIKVKPGTDVVSLQNKMTTHVKANYPASRTFTSTFSLQPLTEIHLGSEALQQRTEIGSPGMRPFYIYLFASVGVLILVIACLNYLNLSTAAAYKRTKEIGTRKTLGAQRGQLIRQFGGEAVILSVVALVIALGLLETILPYVNSFTEKQLNVRQLPVWLQLALTGVMLGAGIVSAVYPAFVIARVKASEALKKNVNVGRASLPMRKLLVASQFAITIFMIASTIVIYRQLNFMKDKDLGVSVQNKVVVDINSGALRRDPARIKNEFRSIPEVQAVAGSTRVPGEWKTFPIATVNNSDRTGTTEMIYVGIDEDFTTSYNLDIIEGRNFTGDRADSAKVMLTRLGAAQLGLKDPIGQVIEVSAFRIGAANRVRERPLRFEVIGIADNFHFESFKTEMMPVMLGYYRNGIQALDYWTLTVATTDMPGTIEKIKQANRRLDPVSPLEYNFLDDKFAEFYRADEKRGQIFVVFSLEIVLIACLGLFALVSYSVESRTKEISIRKTLGATIPDIVMIIGREFVMIVLAAGVVALPAAWYLTDNWLNDFAYRVPLGPGTFATAALLAVVIASVTILVRTIGTARSNPVKWLRGE